MNLFEKSMKNTYAVRAVKYKKLGLPVDPFKLWFSALPPKPDDTADAVAIAICHANCAGSLIGKYYNQR